jgi:mRNA interferase RelE/StbE
MSRALQVYYAAFDDVFLKLPEAVRNRIETEIDDMGRRLATFPHYRMTGGSRYRLRVGDYRIIYTFDPAQNAIHLLAVGHRREIYR